MSLAENKSILNKHEMHIMRETNQDIIWCNRCKNRCGNIADLIYSLSFTDSSSKLFADYFDIYIFLQKFSI